MQEKTYDYTLFKRPAQTAETKIQPLSLAAAEHGAGLVGDNLEYATRLST